MAQLVPLCQEVSGVRRRGRWAFHSRAWCARFPYEILWSLKFLSTVDVVRRQLSEAEQAF